jgi:MFS transporter, DHA1 family, inner membrane transport protein
MATVPAPRADVGAVLSRTALVALTTGIFLTTSSGTAIAPFLLTMAADLGADLVQVGSLVAVSAVFWGLTSLVAGMASDRLGRRPVLLAGLVVLGCSRLLLALAPSYGLALVAHVVAGLGGGAYASVVFATVSDHVPPARRGRALGAVINGQSLSFVIAVPLVTVLASWTGWRGAIAAQGLTMLALSVPLWFTVPRRGAAGSAERVAVTSLRAVVTRRLVALLGAGTMERACFVALAVYLATYLLTTYALSLTMLAVALAVVALGNLAGNVLGGPLADRVPDRALAFAASSIATGLFALPLLLWRPGLAGSVALGVAYMLVNAVGRPSLLAALSDVPAGVRGAVLGLNTTTMSAGWLGASALGGWLIARWGFEALAVFCAVAGLLGAALGVAASRHSHRG